MINPYLDIILAAVIWGSAGVFIKLINLPSTSVTFFRTAVPTVILFIYFIFKKNNLLKKINLPIIFASTINGVVQYFYFLAFSLTSIGNAVVMLYTWPLFAMLFSMLFFNEKVSAKKIILVITAFVGIIFMLSSNKFSFENHDFIGMLAMLASSAIYAITIPIFKNQMSRFTKTETIFYQNVSGALLFLPLIFITKPIPTLYQISLSSFYALLIGLGGYFLFFSGLKKLKSTTASLLSYIEVLSALILSIVLFHEKITLLMAIGACIILVSSYLTKNTD